jgi:hypothetical protein
VPSASNARLKGGGPHRGNGRGVGFPAGGLWGPKVLAGDRLLVSALELVADLVPGADLAFTPALGS